jgi:hypothetical protein
MKCRSLFFFFALALLLRGVSLGCTAEKYLCLGGNDRLLHSLLSQRGKAQLMDVEPGMIHFASCFPASVSHPRKHNSEYMKTQVMVLCIISSYPPN